MPNDIAEARQLIDKNSGSGGLNGNALCDELSQKVMQWTYTVFEVFNVLTERGFDQAAHEQVAVGLIDRINPANLIQLAQSIHGQILLGRIQYIMNCQANNCNVICHHIAEANARAKEIERQSNKTGAPRQLSDKEIALYKQKAGKQKFNMEIIWELPVSGTGFVVYNRDDTSEGLDQIGTKDTVEKIIDIARNWYSLPQKEGLPAIRELQIGDISRPGGIDTKSHGTHMDGKIFDMRPLRKSKVDSALTYSSPDYSLGLTKEFIRMVRSLYPNMTYLYDDPQILGDAEFNGFVRKGPLIKNKKTGKWEESHNNHLHVIFPGGR